MRKVGWLILVAVLTVVTACRRMPLYDLPERIIQLTLELKLEIDLDIKTEIDVDVEETIKIPERMKVGFYGTDNESLLHTEYVGPTGGNINPQAGQYKMLVYSFGTEFVQVRGEDNLNTIEAYTSDITASKEGDLNAVTRRLKTRGDDDGEPQGPIIYPPDHLLVAREVVDIPEIVFEEHDVVVKATAKTVVETYSFEVQTVIGAEYIYSCEAFVTNQSRTIFFGHSGADGRGNPSLEPATLSFPVGVDTKRGCLYTTFNTFGKLPGESRAYLYILIRNMDGLEYVIEQDITEQMESSDHEIVIKEEVVIPEPEENTGGIAPTVEPWEEVEHEVKIG